MDGPGDGALSAVPMIPHCAVSGSGGNLVLIHGLGGHLGHWDPIVPALENRFRVIRYDLRGHGDSGNPEGPWYLDDFIDDLAALADHFCIEQTALAGFSLGGLIAQGFTLKYPAMVERLVLLGTVANRTNRERGRVEERVANLENGRLEAHIRLAVERWFSPEFRQQHPERVQHRLDGLRGMDPGGYLNAYRVFAQADLGNQLHAITCPTLIVTGSKDPGSTVRMAEFMHAEIKDSRLQILPELRHSLLWEAPARVAAELTGFL